MGKSIKLLVLCWVCLFATTFLCAQNAQIGGSIRNAQGSPVVHASIELRNQRTGVRMRTTSDEEGSFSFTELRPGRYHVTVQAKGFKTLTRDRTKIEGQDNIRLDLVLEANAVNPLPIPEALRKP